ncbi:MAG: class I SAM-dependent methyltransferase, partial [Gammaproteobacteria bacterium]|nr:class I SAM-dependent methyltransferase [Gammaproteobacteria bacterium]
FFRDMVGNDEDADALLAPALKAAKYRVVVKRPRKSPYLNNQTPTLSQEGKANRFDIYVNKGMKDSG